MIWMNPSFRMLFLLAGALLGLVAFQPPPARAASPPPVYYVRADGADSANGLSWAAAKRTIQAAVSATPALHQVWVAQGTYKETIDIPSDLLLYGGFRGNEMTTASRTLDAAATTIDGESLSAGSLPVISMKVQNRSVIDGFRVTRGDLGIAATARNIYTSALVISNCLIEQNGGTIGGGLMLQDIASLLISKCKIRSNGAIMGGGLYSRFCHGRIVDSEIVGNTGYMGGGVWAQLLFTDVLQFERCLIGGNTGTWQGGGFYVCGVSYSGTRLSLTDSLICGNNAHDGSAIFSIHSNAPPSDLSLKIDLRHCTVADNWGESETSGTLSLGSAVVLDLQNSILESRHALLVDAGRFSARNCLFQPSTGGALFRTQATSPAYYGAGAINMLAGCAGNIQGDPGFVMDSSAATTGTWTAVVFNDKKNMTTLVDASTRFTPGALAGRLIRPFDASLSNVVITSNTATTILLQGDWRASVSAGKPYRLIDYHLSSASIALDRGDLAFATASDFEGDPRPGSDGKVDIGADEAPAGLTPPPLPPVPDAVPPISRIDPLPPSVPASASLTVRVSDYGSGVSRVQLYYRQKSGGDWRLHDATITTITAYAGQFVFDAARAAGLGGYEFYAVATDHAGNIEAKTPRVEARSFFGIESAAGNILRYLLGLETNPSGLDANADGRVDISDVYARKASFTPQRPFPPDGSYGMPVSGMRLGWSTAAPLSVGLQTYDLYLWPAAKPQPALPTASGLSAQSWLCTSALTPDTAYLWRIVTRVGTWQAPGPIWRFLTRGTGR